MKGKQIDQQLPLLIKKRDAELLRFVTEAEKLQNWIPEKSRLDCCIGAEYL